MPDLIRKGYQATAEGFDQGRYNFKTHIVFTKEGFTVGNAFNFVQPPILDTEINTGSPCYGPDSDKLILGLGGNERISFAPFDKEPTIDSCPVYDWRLLNS